MTTNGKSRNQAQRTRAISLASSSISAKRCHQIKTFGQEQSPVIDSILDENRNSEFATAMMKSTKNYTPNFSHQSAKQAPLA
ncbi:MAG: hypothetical protein WAO76_05035 [Georgfuchsia sp.]